MIDTHTRNLRVVRTYSGKLRSRSAVRNLGVVFYRYQRAGRKNIVD